MNASEREFEEAAADEVPISALEHWSYCPRQCALIHVEQTFDENLFTIRGRIAHERADSGEEGITRGVRVLRAVPLFSPRLGLVGKADVVEMHGSRPFPVEYKVGRRHGTHADLQLCAQALCLEELFAHEVPEGAIYYHALRRRQVIPFDTELRARTMSAIAATRSLLRQQRLPPAANDERCPNCSLINACLPAVIAESARVRGLQGALFVPLAGGDEEAWA